MGTLFFYLRPTLSYIYFYLQDDLQDGVGTHCPTRNSTKRGDLFPFGILGRMLFATWVEVTTWTALKTQCELGGVEVSTAHSFPVDSYPGSILVSAGKTCVIQGNGKTLDAGGSGHILTVSGAGSSLQMHNLSLINGLSGSSVSSSKLFSDLSLVKISLEIPAGHMELLGRSYLC